MHFKRLLSVVISMAITVSMIPVFVSADESEDAPSVTETTQAAEPSETETEATEPEETKPSESETEAAKPVETAPADDADKKDIGHSVKRKTFSIIRVISARTINFTGILMTRPLFSRSALRVEQEQCPITTTGLILRGTFIRTI